MRWTYRGYFPLYVHFCYGDESNDHHARMNGHLTTANQSKIRKVHLVSTKFLGKITFDYGMFALIWIYMKRFFYMSKANQYGGK